MRGSGGQPNGWVHTTHRAERQRAHDIRHTYVAAETVSIFPPSTVARSAYIVAPRAPHLIRTCISGLSDSDGPENKYDLVDAGGPGLRASGLGPFAGLSIFRRQAAPHFASRPPSSRMSCATRAGSSLQRPSTSWVALTSATAPFSGTLCE